MVIIFLFFGYQKWFDYEAHALIPYISHGPLIFWMYPVFGIKGECLFMGVAEWLFGALLFAGFWNKENWESLELLAQVFIHRDLHDHSVHTGRMGSVCRRIPGDD